MLVIAIKKSCTPCEYWINYNVEQFSLTASIHHGTFEQEISVTVYRQSVLAVSVSV